MTGAKTLAVVTALVAATLGIANPAPSVADSPTGALAGAVGYNANGQLGNGTTTSPFATVAVNGLAGVVAVAAGSVHSLALKSDGTVWAWGSNTAGQLGDGTNLQRTSPVAVSGLTDVVAIAAGYSHSLAFKSNGTVWGWGTGSSGELGNGVALDRTTPVIVSGLTDVTAIAAGVSHSLARRSNGTVVAWGYNGGGQLGDGTTATAYAPVAVPGLTGVANVAGGGNHSLALMSNGTVVSWGQNPYGQLGDGTNTPRTTPGAVLGLTGVSAVVAGYDHSLALKTNGTAVAWGRNQVNQLGDGTNLDRSTPVVVSGLIGVSALAAGYTHSIARKTDGTAVAWGSDNYGKLGSASGGQQSTPVAMASLTGVTAIAGGGDHTVVAAEPALLRVVSSPPVPSQISIDGKIADTWGLAYLKVLPGPHTVTFAHVEGYTDPEPIVTTPAAGVATTVTGVFVQRGFLHVTTSPPTPGTIYVDGTPRNDWGMWTDIPAGSHAVCFGPVAGLTTPACQTVNVTAGATANVSGAYATNAASQAGLLAGGFGSNLEASLGDGTLTDRSVPVAVHGLTGATAIAAGSYHSLALRPDGTVLSWGHNTYGELGDGTTTTRTAAVPVAGLTGVTAIAAGTYHSLALKSDGTVVAWGNNGSGQLGDASTTDRITPVTVSGLSGVTNIAAGGSHSLARKTDGTVVAWGANTHGQLGDNTIVAHNVPTAVPGLTGVASLDGGQQFSLALKTDGTVAAWGYNNKGQIGDGTQNNDRKTPVAVPGLTGVSAVTAGFEHAVAVKTDGTVIGWGNNDWGQFGDGTSASHITPTAVPGLLGVSSVSAGYYHSLARRTDGSVWAWGSDLYGQLGNGAPSVGAATPAPVAQLTGAVAVAAGDFHSLVLAQPAVLRVVTAPSVPSQISIDGDIADTWGVSYVKVLPVAHTVSFNHVEGFTEPAPITTTPIAGQTTTVTGSFAQRGFLHVTTSPATPGTIYAGTIPRNDWGMWTDLPIGSYTVCFGPVVGLTPSGCQVANVTAGSTATINGTYS